MKLLRCALILLNVLAITGSVLDFIQTFCKGNDGILVYCRLRTNQFCEDVKSKGIDVLSDGNSIGNSWCYENDNGSYIIGDIPFQKLKLFRGPYKCSYGPTKTLSADTYVCLEDRNDTRKPDNERTDSSSEGQNIGIGVGIGAILVILFGAIYGVVVWRSKRARACLAPCLPVSRPLEPTLQIHVDRHPAPIHTPKKIFHLPLVQVIQDHEGNMPPVFLQLIEEIERRGLVTEGLYRKCASNDAIVQIAQRIDQRDDSIDFSENSIEDVQTLAGVLKWFFNKLKPPAPLTEDVTKELNELFGIVDESERLERFRKCLRKLPVEHVAALRTMCQHLRRVHEKSETNLMSADNLALVFAPTFMELNNKSRLDFNEQTKRNAQIFGFIILHYDVLLD